MALTSETKVSATIDWFSITCSDSAIPYPKHWTTKYTPHRGMLNYDIGREFLDGRIELVSSKRANMRPHIIFSGDVIRNLTEAWPHEPMGILEAFRDGKPTRIDIAVDVRFGSLDIERLRDEMADGMGGSRALSSMFIQAVGEAGETLYIGAPKSKKRLRIYDKQAEQKTDFAWTRIELQLREKYARQCVLVLLGKNDLGAAIAGIIRDFATFPENDEWQTVLGSSSVSLPAPEPIKSNRHDWLMTTAAKALAKEVFERQDHAVAETFLDYYQSHLRTLQDGIKDTSDA